MGSDLTRRSIGRLSLLAAAAVAGGGTAANAAEPTPPDPPSPVPDHGEGATAQLCDFVARTGYADLPADAIHDTKRAIIDALGCALGGTTLDGGRIVMATAEEMGGPGQATIMGSGRKVSPAAAAFANVYLNNVLDADDTLFYKGHPAGYAVFGALATTEARRRSGRELIAAVALGYEAGARIGLSLIPRPAPARDIGASWLSFATAVGAGKGLGLNAGQLANVIGINGVGAPLADTVLWRSLLVRGKNMAKYGACSAAGSNGVMSAMLAEKGFTGAPALLDGEEGFWRMVGAAGYDRDVLTGDLGRRTWLVSQTSLKPYASGRFSNLAIDLFRRIITQHAVRPEAIQGVKVYTFPAASQPWFASSAPPQTQIDMAFSIPLALAATAYGSDLGPQWVSHAAMADDHIAALATKVQVLASPEAARAVAQQVRAEHHFKRVPTKVEVQTAKGVFTAEGDLALGDPWTPESRMTDEQLLKKFRTFADGVIPPVRIEKLAAMLLDLDRVEDISAQLTPLLAPA